MVSSYLNKNTNKKPMLVRDVNIGFLGIWIGDLLIFA
jgi:hypothetical protein